MNPWSGITGRISAWVMSALNEDMEREAVTRLALPPDAHVLEVGFGPGKGIRMLAERFETGRVFGVDPSPTMVEIATRRNERHVATGRVTLWAAAADRLPLADASLDAIVMVNSLQLAKPLEASLRECARALRAGGVLVTLTHAWAAPEPPGPDAWIAHVRDVLGTVGFDDVTAARGRALSGRTILIEARRAPART